MSVDLGPGLLQLPCLGRPFRLGMLYDCRSDTLIPGITLWDEANLKNVESQSQQSSDVSIIADDSISSKSSALDIKAGLKLSFLAGLISVSGSAKYLDDRKSSSHQSRLTMKYNCTTEFRQLTMAHLGKGNVQHPDVFDGGKATHVVTGISYGAQAFLVFDRQDTDEEIRKNVEGELHVLVKAIPDIKIDGEGSLKMSEDDKKKVDKFDVKFHGDFIPTVNPTSFAEAVKLYKELPQQLGKNNETAVPVTVHLYPLEHMDSKAAKLVREISANLVSQTQDSIEQLHSLSIRCNDLGKTPACRNSPVIRNRVAKFHKMVKDYLSVFTKQLIPILPKIRGGGAKESELIKVFRQREASPFSHSLLTQWLDRCEGLIKVMGIYITSMASVKFASEQGDLLAEIMNPEYRYCVCFTTQLYTEEPLVIAMEKYLRNCDDASYSPDPVSISDSSLFDRVRNDMAKNARHFTNLYKANTEATDVTFIVAEDGAVTDKPGASICLYEEGKLIDKNFKPPSAPRLLHKTQVAHDELTVGWKEPNTESGNVTHYRISHKTSDASDWVVANTTDNAARHHVIKQLLPFTRYLVKVNAVCMAGSCQDSDVLTITTRPTNPPGKPTVWKASALKIRIEWTEPKILQKKVTIHSYDIEKCLMSGEAKTKWTSCFSTKGNQLCCDIHQGPQAPYRYRVIANCGKRNSLPSEASDEIRIEAKSEEILKKTICEGSKKVVDSNNPLIYQVQLEELTANTSSMVRKITFGKAMHGVPEKVILIVGATGTGKTTFINGILNYIFGVDWKDNFRFRLVDEGCTGNQAKSQTQWVTAYTLNHQIGFRIPYTLTIVDTPGFGDTTGIQRDKEIAQQLKQFFSTKGAGGIDHIDCIGFVIQASLPRLTHTQKFVFDSVLSLFGKDIGESIYLMITFCDGQKPPVLAGVDEAELPYKKFFKFNNSALYASQADRTDGLEDESDDDDGEGQFDEMFWKMGVSSYKKFLNELAKTKGKSLVLTNSVLEQRQRLEVIVTGIQTQIQAGLNKLEQLRFEVAILKDHKKDIERNRSFTYVVRESRMTKKDIQSGLYTTNCLKCNFTCHYPCAIPDDKNKSGCSAMSLPNNHCNACPKHCIWSMHHNVPFIFEVFEEEVTKTYDELKKRYLTAKDKTMSAETLIEKVLEDFEAVKMDVLSKTNEVRIIINQLQEIALKPNPLTAVDYIDLLIESEKLSAKVGWIERVQHLTSVRKEAEILATMAKDGYDPFEQYSQVVAEAKAAEAEAEAEKEESSRMPKWMRTAGKFLKDLTGTHK